MKTTKNLKGLLKQIKKHKEAIAKERDALREILEDVEDVVGSMNEGVIALESAIDTMSQYN